jgi:hypothetical protein
MTQTMPASDNVICYVRRNREWAESYSFGEEHQSVWNVLQISSVWNELFNIKYTDFRKHLNKIQRKNLSDIGFSSVINQYEYSKVDHQGWIVPTDDDDWFHPDLISALQSSNSKLVYWNFINFTEGVVSVQDSRQEAVQYESNNYAIMNSPDEMLLRYHYRANQVYKNKAGKHLDCCLSIHNRTMASLGLLKNQLPDLRTGMIRLYEISRKRATVIGNVPDYFAKFIDEITEVFQKELKIRRMFL